MPVIALFLSLVLIAWLLVVDVKCRPTVSPAIWLPVCLVVVYGSRPLSAWFGPPAAGAEAQPIDHLFYLSVLLGSWIVATSRRLKWGQLIAANIPLAIFYFYFGLSILWSDNPVGSFSRWFKDVGLVVILSVVLSEKDRAQAIQAVYVRSAAILLPLSIVVIRYYSDIGRLYHVTGELLVTGLTDQKNSLGQCVMIVSLFLGWEYLIRHSSYIAKTNLILLLMGAWLLIASGSKTALVCTGLGLILMLIPYRSALSAALSRAFLVAILFLAVTLPLQDRSLGILSPLLKALGRDLTFTGRDAIWSSVLKYQANPLIGAGYSNFWGSPGATAMRKSVHVPVLSAHNAYLDSYLDGGVVGVVLLIVVLMGTAWSVMKRPRSNQCGQLRVAVLVIAMVYSLTETTLPRPTLLWFTTLLALVSGYPMPRTNAAARREEPAAPYGKTTGTAWWDPAAVPGVSGAASGEGAPPSSADVSPGSRPRWRSGL